MPIRAQGPAQRRLAPGQACIEDQGIEAIILRAATPDRDEPVFERVPNGVQVDMRTVLSTHGHRVDPILARGIVGRLFVGGHWIAGFKLNKQTHPFKHGDAI